MIMMDADVLTNYLEVTLLLLACLLACLLAWGLVGWEGGRELTTYLPNLVTS